MHSIDQRDGNVTQVGNHSEEQQAAPIPHLLVPRVHPRTPRGHQWGHCTGGGQAATGRTRVLRGTNEPPPKAPKFFQLQMAWADVTNVHVDGLVDDKDVLVDWVLVGLHVEPGRDDGAPYHDGAWEMGWCQRWFMRQQMFFIGRQEDSRWRRARRWDGPWKERW